VELICLDKFGPWALTHLVVNVARKQILKAEHYASYRLSTFICQNGNASKLPPYFPIPPAVPGITDPYHHAWLICGDEVSLPFLPRLVLNNVFPDFHPQVAAVIGEPQQVVSEKYF
jgi:hypothetical protein